MNFFVRLQQLSNVAQLVALHISSADSQDLAIPAPKHGQADSVVDHHAQMGLGIAQRQTLKIAG
jgi:hypothetical protein